MALGGSPELVRPLNRQLWKKFVHIAQPYFYPMVRGGGWMTLLLIVMLLVLVFALLVLCVTAVTLVRDQRRLQLYRQFFYQCAGAKKSGPGVSVCGRVLCGISDWHSDRCPVRICR